MSSVLWLTFSGVRYTLYNINKAHRRTDMENEQSRDLVSKKQGAVIDIEAQFQLLNFDGALKSRNTAITYTWLLRKFARHLEASGIDIYQVDRSVVVQYMDWLRQNGNEKRSVNNTIKAIKRFYNVAIEAGKVDANPCEGIPYYKEERKTPKALNEDMMVKLAKTLFSKDSEANQRDYAVINIMAMTGMRASELCAMRFRDIIIEDGHVVALVIPHGKGDKWAQIEFDDAAYELIKAYRQRIGMEIKQDDFVFYSVPNNRYKDRRPLNRLSLYYLVRRVGERMGIKKLHPHKLRHTFVTDLIKAGCPLHLVQKAARHSSINTTMIYTHDDTPYISFLGTMRQRMAAAAC